MILEFIDSLRVRCVPGARELGLVHESVAIASRHRRVGASWTTHLEESRAAILRGAARCEKRQRACVIGAGTCLDVPVAELAGLFAEVILADAVVSPVARRWARSSRHVRAVAWDATGALEKLAAGRRALTPTEALQIMANAEPVPLPGGEADLVVSANCLSQLGLIPAGRLAADEIDEAFAERCAAVAAKRHLSWLAAQPGVRVLLSDRARIDVSPDGREISRENIFNSLELRPSDASWRWELAPIPEWSPAYHRVHEVGAWIEGGRAN